jgi:hypothetical protein
MLKTDHYPLFFGFLLSPAYQDKLAQLPESIRSSFIQKTVSPYLQQIEYEGKTYLGKSLGHSIELTALEGMESHIDSLLRYLIPDYPYENCPLVLLALPTWPLR